MAVLVLTAIMLALPAERPCVAVRDPRRHPDGRRTRQGYRAGRHQHLGGRPFHPGQEARRHGLGQRLATWRSSTRRRNSTSPSRRVSGARSRGVGHDGVRDGSDADVLIAGNFPRAQVQHQERTWSWSTALPESDPVVQLAVAEVGSGRARAREGLRRGGESLGVRLRHRQEAVDQSEDHRRPHHTHPRQQACYRDLELDADGQTIWAACVCDAVNGNPAKALVKLGHRGQPRHLVVDRGGEGGVRPIGR